MDFVITIIEQGLIYGILALGVYITYKILDFPDLTVDGSFPLGAAVTAALLTRGISPFLTLGGCACRSVYRCHSCERESQGSVIRNYYDDRTLVYQSLYCRNVQCTAFFTENNL